MSQPFALIIEDDPKLAQIFTITLNAHFDVQAVTDGNQAIVRLSEIVPQIVVLDLNLPGAKGEDILRNIRADPRLVKTKVILATADARKADILRDDADIVLLKPVSPSQLRELALRLA